MQTSNDILTATKIKTDKFIASMADLKRYAMTLHPRPMMSNQNALLADLESLVARVSLLMTQADHDLAELEAHAQKAYNRPPENSFGSFAAERQAAAIEQTRRDAKDSLAMIEQCRATLTLVRGEIADQSNELYRIAYHNVQV